MLQLPGREWRWHLAIKPITSTGPTLQKLALCSEHYELKRHQSFPVRCSFRAPVWDAANMNKISTELPTI